MRKANKSGLASALTKNSTKLSETLTKATHVLDRGALLHQVYWNIPATYAEILMQYTSYFDKKYGKGCLIVFDGYKSSTKDEERQRRSMQGSIEVVFQLHNEVQCKQLEFLANSNKKKCDSFRVWRLCSKNMAIKRQFVIELAQDADLTTVENALKIANDGSHATVVADDTDILVMLLIK